MQMARRTVIFTVDAAGIASLMDAAREDIPGLTTNEIVQAVANHNPDTFWAIARKDNFDISLSDGRGFPRGAAADARRHAPADRRQPRYAQSRYFARRAAIGAAGGNLCLGDSCQGLDRRRDPAGAAEILDAALPGRQYLFATDHQGRPPGSGAARVFSGSALRRRDRAASADAGSFARGCPRSRSGAGFRIRSGRSFDGRNDPGDRDPRRRLYRRAALSVRGRVRRQRLFRNAPDLSQGTRAGRLHAHSILRRFRQARTTGRPRREAGTLAWPGRSWTRQSSSAGKKATAFCTRIPRSGWSISGRSAGSSARRTPASSHFRISTMSRSSSKPRNIRNA